MNKKLFIFYIAMLVSVGGILYGYDMGVISGALLFIRNTIALNDEQIGLIVGAVLGGSLIGTLLAGPISDYYGRRFLILLASIIFIIGITFILLANTFLFLFLSRILLGIAVGIISVGVPLYIAEIIPSEKRGRYVTFFQLLLTFGILLAYFMDYLFTPTGNWRAMFAVLLIPSFVLLIGILFLPETPRFLMMRNKLPQAKLVLAKIYNTSAALESEFAAMKKSVLEVQQLKEQKFFSRATFAPSLLAIFVAIFNQLTGINSFLQYAPLILKQAGIQSNNITMIGSVGIGTLNFLFTIIAINLIDTLGRRPLLLIGLAGIVFSEIFLCCINFFISQSPYLGILSLIGLLFFIIFFAVGPGVVVWLVIAELFPTAIRGKGISVALFFNSLFATLLATFFLPLTNHLGISFSYLLFASFSMIYFLIVYLFLPETKAQSLEEIEHFFD